jgi:hypothetical protein
MADEKTPTPPAPPEAPSQTAEPPPRTREVRPGHIPVPPERSWDAEPADPYVGIDRRDPFAGRPPSRVPQPDEPPSSDEDPGPGQPRK